MHDARFATASGGGIGWWNPSPGEAYPPGQSFFPGGKGGTVITEAGAGEPNVRQLVYITSILPELGRRRQGW
ncbi:MAG: hypothetical protein M3228_03455 [Actinomycetota bacterium]|nr:hypothetical protein [Actinomycetota bacterium]